MRLIFAAAGFSMLSLALSWTTVARAEFFDITKLPKGKDITLIRPATTHVPMATRARFGATDTPQSLSLRSVAKKGRAAAIKVAIYDKNSPRVRYVVVRPGTPFIYSFKGLSTVMLIPERESNPGKAGSTRLQIQSDKPLSIAR